MNRCGSFPLLSASHSLFSIWTNLKTSEKIPGAPTRRWGEWIWLTGPSGLHRNSPQWLNISSIRVFDQIRHQKVLTTFFLFQHFTNYLRFRTNDNVERRRALLWTARASTFSLRSHKDPVAFVSALPRCSDPKIRMKCYLILRKLHRTCKISLKIILRPCKINLLMYFFRIISNNISSTTSTKQNKKHIFLGKLSNLDPILYINFLVLSTVLEWLLKGWHYFPSTLYIVSCFVCKS